MRRLAQRRNERTFFTNFILPVPNEENRRVAAEVTPFTKWLTDCVPAATERVSTRECKTSVVRTPTKLASSLPFSFHRSQLDVSCAGIVEAMSCVATAVAVLYIALTTFSPIVLSPPDRASAVWLLPVFAGINGIVPAVITTAARFRFFMDRQLCALAIVYPLKDSLTHKIRALHARFWRRLSPTGACNRSLRLARWL